MPLAGSMPNTTSEFEFWFATISHRPDGSMAKCRGVRPPVAPDRRRLQRAGIDREHRECVAAIDE
jgi:hypothetical protein